jgi:hypothetical protein
MTTSPVASAVALTRSVIADGSLTGGDGRHRVDGTDSLSAPDREVDYRLSEAGAARLARIGVAAIDGQVQPALVQDGHPISSCPCQNSAS